MSTPASRRAEESRNATLKRVARLIDHLLRGHPLDRHAAADLLELSPVAVDRQLKTLVGVAGMTSSRVGRKTVYRFDPGRLLGAPNDSAVIAACFGSSLWRLFEGTAYEEGMREVLEKVVQIAKRRTDYEDIRRKFLFVERGGEVISADGPGILDDIVDALLRPKLLALRYLSFDGVAHRVVVEPLSIAVYDHQLYLLARPRPGGAVHPYRLARIRAADAVEGRFKYPSPGDYDPAQVFADSFGIFLGAESPVERVKVRLHPRYKHYVRSHRWHRSQRVRTRGGELVVEMNVKVCPELEAWILGMGEWAEVLTPEWLRSKLAGRVRKMAQRDRKPVSRRRATPN